MPHWPWIERSFTFDFPPTKWPDLLERVRGTPARIEDCISAIDSPILTKSDGKGWSIQQNIGHLMDQGYLPMQRIEEILAGKETLVAADMTNRATKAANHNERDIKELLAEFRTERAALVAKFESLDETDWARSALHPRLKQPMRIVDIAYFDSEHDDYHLARIAELVRALG